MSNNNNKEFKENKIFKKQPIMIEGIVMGFIVRYKEHYCIVSLNQKQMLIKDENDEIVANRGAGEEYFDVFALYRLVPDIVANYIDTNLEKLDEIQLSKKEEKIDEK